jgi:hypothetical protein
MYIPLRIQFGLAVAALMSFGRHFLRTGYFPREWPLKLSLVMGIMKAAFGYISEFTLEEVQSIDRRVLTL